MFYSLSQNKLRQQLSAAAWSKSNLCADSGSLACSGVADFSSLDLEEAGSFLQDPARSIGALDRAPQVLEPGSRFGHEPLQSNQVLSMPKFGVISWCDFRLFLPQHAAAVKGVISLMPCAAVGFAGL